MNNPILRYAFASALPFFILILCLFASPVVLLAQTDANVIMHKVEKGQTLFGIARKYQASIADIRSLNAGLKEGLQVDQMIKVPVKEGQAKETGITQIKVAEKAPTAPLERPSGSISAEEAAGRAQHVVGVGQTLGMIARTYKTTVAEILKWNNMTNPNIRIGQRIVVSPPLINVTLAKATKSSDAMAAKATVAPKEASVESIISVSGAAVVGKESGLEQQVEKGLAEGIDQDDNNKQQCLHRTAAVGTVLKVKNDLNGLSVYAKVVGKLPEIGPNEKLVIRLSKSTFEKLMPTERRFPVTITFSQSVSAAK